MSSTFGSLNTAASGLYAAQRGVDVTGQNIANVNTDGYSRQRVNLQAVGASAVPAIWARSSSVGDGVDSSSVTRIRDAFLESRAQTEHASSAQLTTENDTYNGVQQTFGEPSDTGIQSQLTSMWGAWQDLANAQATNAGSVGAGAGSELIQTTQSVLDSFHSTRASLDQQWTQTQSDLQALVSNVNAAAATIASLNKQIQLGTSSGANVNALSDQRDQLVLQLSEQIGATSRPGDRGSVDVAVGGVTLVSGTLPTPLAVAGPTDPNTTTLGAARIVTADGTATLVAGGTAGGQLSALNSTIPSYRNQLDAVARDMAQQINDQLGNGYDSTGALGKPMFGSSSAGPIDAATITLKITDPAQLGISVLGPDANGVAATNGGNADAISQLGNTAGSPDNSYRAMITQLGVQAGSVSRALDIQTTVTSTVDNNRESVSGVSIDEEMTNMLSFQHAYSASARLITAIDQNLDTLINHMGLVGNA